MGKQHLIEMDVIEDVYMFNLKSSKSPLLGEYYDRTELWTLLSDSISDEFLINLMVFNLEFNISPLHVFLKYYNERLKKVVLTKFTRRCIGSHVSFILASLGYKRTKRVYRKDAIIKYGGLYEKQI